MPAWDDVRRGALPAPCLPLGGAQAALPQLVEGWLAHLQPLAERLTLHGQPRRVQAGQRLEQPVEGGLVPGRFGDPPGQLVQPGGGGLDQLPGLLLRGPRQKQSLASPCGQRSMPIRSAGSPAWASWRASFSPPARPAASASSARVMRPSSARPRISVIR
jgi:hypothetical protein